MSAVLKPISFAGQAFDAVTLDGVFEISLGYAYKYLIFSSFIRLRREVVKTFERIAKKTLLFPKQIFNLEARADAFAL